MLRILLYFAVFFIGNSFAIAQNFPYEREFGTYYGNSHNIVRDAVADTAGNLYIVSQIRANTGSDPNNYATVDAHQTTFGGESDVFLSKFSFDGDLVWATYYGGESFEKPTQIIIDQNNDIYIVGNTGSSTNIATPGAYQTERMINGDDPDINSSSGFMAKFSTDGTLQYGTYYDGEANDKLSGITVTETHIYIIGITNSETNIATEGSYQSTFATIDDDQHYLFLVKFDHLGQRQWATYYGPDINTHGTLNYLEPSIGIGLDLDGNVYLSSNTSDQTGYFASSNAVYQPQNSSTLSFFISKFNSDGDRIWSTYFGGTNTDAVMNLEFNNGHVYLCGYTFSDNFAIGNVYQSELAGITDDFLLKMDLDGNPVWATYFGGTGTINDASNISMISFSEDNGIWLSSLSSIEGLATSGAYQTVLNDSALQPTKDAYFAKFDVSGMLDFASYYGGENDGYELSKVVTAPNAAFYIVGTTGSETGIATDGAQQATVIENPETQSFQTMYIGKFSSTALNINSFHTTEYNLSPNPSTGVIKITSSKNENINLKLYDAQGRLIKKMDEVHTNDNIDLQHKLSNGLYFLKVETEEPRNNQVFKLLLE